MIQTVGMILYVHDQQASTEFYTQLFRKEPSLYVPGMTEFQLTPSCTLGLMPNEGIAKILLDQTPDPSEGSGIPRCEVYLYTENVEFEYHHALQIGAQLISPLMDRDWGDKVCYFADRDGHIIAFAQK